MYAIKKGDRIEAILFALFLCLYSSIVYAQTSFPLSKEGMHYYMYATVNGHENTRLFVESGVPGLIISEADFDRLFKDCQFEKIDSAPAEMKHQFGTRKIRKLLKGKIRIGDLSYKGSIWVVDKYEIEGTSTIALPVHRLGNEKDSIAYVIQLDFKNKSLDMVTESSIEKSEMKSYKMVGFIPMPIFESDLFISDDFGHYGNLTGRFLLDFGNPMPLYLFYKNPIVRKFLKEKEFKISHAGNKKVKLIEQGLYSIYVSKLKIGGKKINNILVAITTTVALNNEELGFVGPSFFKDRIIIDNKNRLIYFD